MSDENLFNNAVLEIAKEVGTGNYYLSTHYVTEDYKKFVLIANKCENDCLGIFNKTLLEMQYAMLGYNLNSGDFVENIVNKNVDINGIKMSCINTPFVSSTNKTLIKLYNGLITSGNFERISTQLVLTLEFAELPVDDEIVEIAEKINKLLTEYTSTYWRNYYLSFDIDLANNQTVGYEINDLNWTRVELYDQLGVTIKLSEPYAIYSGVTEQYIYTQSLLFIGTATNTAETMFSLFREVFNSNKDNFLGVRTSGYENITRVELYCDVGLDEVLLRTFASKISKLLDDLTVKIEKHYDDTRDASRFNHIHELALRRALFNSAIHKHNEESDDYHWSFDNEL